MASPMTGTTYVRANTFQFAQVVALIALLIAGSHSPTRKSPTLRREGVTCRPDSIFLMASRQAVHASFLVAHPPLVIWRRLPVSGSGGTSIQYVHVFPRWFTCPFMPHPRGRAAWRSRRTP